MQIIYRAVDGTDFLNEDDCIWYERVQCSFPKGVNFYTEEFVPMAYGTAEQFHDCMTDCAYMELTNEINEYELEDFGVTWDIVTAGLGAIGFYKWGMDEAQFGEVDPYGWIKIEDPRKEN